MLPDNYRKLLYSNELLNNFEYKVIILENINTKIVVATISIRIGNTHSNLGKIGFIRDVILYDNYNNKKTHEYALKSALEYCKNEEDCISVIVSDSIKSRYPC
jgi:hypothetical protein